MNDETPVDMPPKPKRGRPRGSTNKDYSYAPKRSAPPRMAAGLPPFVPAYIVQWQIGLGLKHLRAAMRAGLLQPGRHILHRERREPLYHLENLRAIAQDVQAVTWSEEARKKRLQQLRRLGCPDRALISTTEKLRLQDAIRKAMELERDLMTQLDRVAIQREKLQDDYWLVLWERADCPRCLGHGVLKSGAVCIYCATRTESTAASAADSAGRSSESPSIPPSCPNPGPTAGPSSC